MRTHKWVIFTSFLRGRTASGGERKRERERESTGSCALEEDALTTRPTRRSATLTNARFVSVMMYELTASVILALQPVLRHCEPAIGG